MVRRLPIKRKSIVLPALCLLALVTMVLGVAWLTWVGIPRPLLDFVRERAEREGIYLTIEEAYLAPDLGLGLKVGGVELYADCERRQKLLHCDDISAGVRLMPLLCGEIVPVQMGIGKTRVSLPVDDEGHTLDLSTGGIVLNGDREGRLGIATAHLCVQDFLDLNFSGRINLPTPAEAQEKKEEDASPVDIAALLRENREMLYAVYERIENLKSTGAPHIHIYTSVGLGKWDGKGTMPLLVRTRFDIEELDVKPMTGITLPPLPGVDVDGTEVEELPVIHFRDIKVDVEYRAGQLKVNSISLRTVQPDTEISLSGAYDLNTRETALQVDGQLMLFDLLQTTLGDKLPPVLRGIRSSAKMPLGISVRANAELSDIPGEAPKRAEVRVGLDQKDLYLGPTLLKQAYLSFFYNGRRLHVDKLKVLFRDDRGLEAMFNPGEEADTAYLHGEVEVQDLLDIAEYFTGAPITLPEGLILGNSVRIDSKLRFASAPGADEPTKFEDLIPQAECVHVAVSMPGLSYGDTELLGPRVSLLAEGCRSESAMELPFIQHARVRLSADSVHLGMGEDAQSFSGVQLNLHARNIQPPTEGRELGIEAVSLQAAAEHADCAAWHAEGIAFTLQEMVPPLRREAVQPRISLKARSFSGNAGGLSLAVPGAQLTMDCRLPQGWESIDNITLSGTLDSFTMGEARVDNAVLKCFELAGIPLSGNKAYRPERAALELTTGPFSYGSSQCGGLTVRVEAPGPQQAMLQCRLGDSEESAQRLALTVDWSSDHMLGLKNLQAELHPAAMADFLTALGVQTEDIRWPETLMLAGNATLGLEDEGICLQTADAKVELPHLVRTSHNVPMLRGRENEVALSVEAQARQEKPGAPLLYSGTLQLTHLPEQKQLNTQFRGSSAGQVNITGETDILPTVIDELLDLNDAHEIIRDFRMPAGAQSKVSDIDVNIDYSNGLSLHSVCRAELRNIEYLLGGIEAVKDADGKPMGEEVMNKEDGVQPFSALNTVSCIVDVVEKSGMKDAQGNTIPRETIITLRNPYMDFNNAPWLKELSKSEFAPDDRANPPARSVLKGESVVLDIQRSTVELNKLAGTIYPAYSIGTFYYPLRDFMKDVLFFSPVNVKADYCRFPIADDCTQPMTGTISLRAPRDTVFDFLGTGYPLDKLTGFIRINDTSVYLDRLNAMTFSGTVNAQLDINFSGDHTLLDGYVNMKNVNLRQLAAAYGADLSRALCAADFRFRYQLPDLNNLKGYGTLSVIDGNLLELGIFSPVRSLITVIPNRVMSFFSSKKKEQKDGAKTGVLGKKADKKPDTDEENPWDTFIDHAFTGPINHIPFINHFTNMTLREAHADFGIVGGHLLAKTFKVKGNNLNVHVNDFDINLDTLGISATLEPKVNSLPGFLFSTLDYLFNFKITGTINEISWSVLLRPGIPDKDLRTIKAIFGEAHPASKKPEPLLHPKPARKSTRKRR